MKGQIQGLLFDFDGLMVDTESATRRAWEEAYARFGVELPDDLFDQSVGTRIPFDPLRHLQEATGLDLTGIKKELWAREAELIGEEGLRPGVVEYVEEAAAMGLRLAVVSSSSVAWVGEHLERLGIQDRWDGFFCADEDTSVAKPRPILYERALTTLGLDAREAVAFEDSPNGIAAAKSAGLFCVAVPNSVTASMDLSAADLSLRSLSDVPLSKLLARVLQEG